MRHRQRHVHKTILEYVRTELTTLGWTTAPGQFGSPLVTLQDYEPLVAGETPPENRVAVSMGDQGETQPFELGAGVREVAYAVFIDVYPSSEPVGVALAEDIKDFLVDAVIPLKDFTSDPDGVGTTDEIEFTRVLVEHLPTATTTIDKRSWRSVKATAILYFT